MLDEDLLKVVGRGPVSDSTLENAATGGPANVVRDTEPSTRSGVRPTINGASSILRNPRVSRVRPTEGCMSLPLTREPCKTPTDAMRAQSEVL